jgi:hypothetical protein
MFYLYSNIKNLNLISFLLCFSDYLTQLTTNETNRTNQVKNNKLITSSDKIVFLVSHFPIKPVISMLKNAKVGLFFLPKSAGEAPTYYFVNFISSLFNSLP